MADVDEEVAELFLMEEEVISRYVEIMLSQSASASVAIIKSFKAPDEHAKNRMSPPLSYLFRRVLFIISCHRH